VDRMREFLRTAVGKPADQERWGPRVGGGDALNVSPELHFAGVGQLCRDIHAASERTDYRNVSRGSMTCSRSPSLKLSGDYTRPF